MSTQCLQTAGNNVKLFTCVFDADDLGAELEAPPPWACRIHKEVHRLGAPWETAKGRWRARGCRRARAAEGEPAQKKNFFRGAVFRAQDEKTQ